MIDVDMYRKIRQCKNDGLSQRATAKKLRIWRGTVTKYWDGGHLPDERAPPALAQSVGKTELKAAMAQYCDEHKDDQLDKQKINAHILWRDLHFEYPRSQATYRRYWAEIRAERQIETRVPLLFSIGHAAEMDWVEVKARYKGGTVKLYIFCMVLMYGYTPFLKAYPNMKTQNFIDGHVSALSFYKGSARCIIYDNLPTGRKSGYGYKASKTKEFAMLAAHYGFDAEFCKPYDPPSKGGVENLADTAADIMTPVRDFECISEINEILLEQCRQDIGRDKPVGLRPRAVKEMTAEERGYLIPLPLKRYEVPEEKEVTVNSQQLFRFDKFLYSVPRMYAGKTVAVKAYPYRVEVYYKGHMVWGCDRPMFAGDNAVHALHYTYDLKSKPRARGNAFPLKEGVLPPALHEFRKLCKAANKYNQLYELLAIMDEAGPEELLKAVETANAAGDPTYGKVMDILSWPLPADCGAGLDVSGVTAAGGGFEVEQRNPSGFDILFGVHGNMKK